MEAPTLQELKKTSQLLGRPQTCPMNVCNEISIDRAHFLLSRILFLVLFVEKCIQLRIVMYIDSQEPSF
jgi:hypothetical protein